MTNDYDTSHRITNRHRFFSLIHNRKNVFFLVSDHNNFHRRVKNAEGNNNRQISHELLVSKWTYTLSASSHLRRAWYLIYLMHLRIDLAMPRTISAMQDAISRVLFSPMPHSPRRFIYVIIIFHLQRERCQFISLDGTLCTIVIFDQEGWQRQQHNWNGYMPWFNFFLIAKFAVHSAAHSQHSPPWNENRLYRLPNCKWDVYHRMRRMAYDRQIQDTFTHTHTCSLHASKWRNLRTDWRRKQTICIRSA